MKGSAKVSKKLSCCYQYNIWFTSKKENKVIKRYSFSLHHLYFSSGLSLRNTSKALSKSVHRRSHTTAIRVDWILKYKPSERLFYHKVKIAEFIIDKTLKVGSAELVWLWYVVIEPESKRKLKLQNKKKKICS